MSTLLSRSARLASKGSGAHIPPTADVKIRGHNMPSSCLRILSMDFHMRWRAKDYGDACIEDWCFSLYLRNNLGQMMPSLSFWRNFVYFTASHIHFGYYDSQNYIYKNANGEAVLHKHSYKCIEEFILAAPFDEVVARFQAATTKLTIVVHDSTVYTFSLGEVAPNTYIDEIKPPVTRISFV